MSKQTNRVLPPLVNGHRLSCMLAVRPAGEHMRWQYKCVCGMRGRAWKTMEKASDEYEAHVGVLRASRSDARNNAETIVGSYA